MSKVPTTDVAVDPRVDVAILDSATDAWCKVAVLIARATDAARAADIDVKPQDIANRIYAMTSDNRLEVTGNVRRWRAAEVRRRASPTAQS